MWLIHVNAVTFALAVFVLLTTRTNPLNTVTYGVGGYWPAHHRDLSVIDRTGDAQWHQAISDAITTWDRAGSGLRLTLTLGSGACHQANDHIEICESTLDAIADQGLPGEQGLFVPTISGSSLRAAILLVCSDCDVDQVRRTVIATHEVGHALGLNHSSNYLSVMSPTGGSTEPDAKDEETLRSVYGRSDGGT